MNHSQTETRVVAVFGGTFDPPTLAHEAIIGACLKEEGIDEVWVMPSGQRLDKPHMLDNQNRLEMLEVMKAVTFRGLGKLVISDFEMYLPQPSHTYSTVQALRQTYPGHRFHFVFGADSYATMGSWQHGQELLDNLSILVVPRSGTDMPLIRPNVGRLTVPGVVALAMSSTKVRDAYFRGESVDEFVSPAVAKYLESNHCYQAV